MVISATYFCGCLGSCVFENFLHAIFIQSFGCVFFIWLPKQNMLDFFVVCNVSFQSSFGQRFCVCFESAFFHTAKSQNVQYRIQLLYHRNNFCWSGACTCLKLRFASVCISCTELFRDTNLPSVIIVQLVLLKLIYTDVCCCLGSGAQFFKENDGR